MEAFEESKMLSNKYKDNWFGSMYSILKYLHIPLEYLNRKSNKQSIIIKRLRIKFDEFDLTN